MLRIAVKCPGQLPVLHPLQHPIHSLSVRFHRVDILDELVPSHAQLVMEHSFHYTLAHFDATLRLLSSKFFASCRLCLHGHFHVVHLLAHHFTAFFHAILLNVFHVLQPPLKAIRQRRIFPLAECPRNILSLSFDSLHVTSIAFECAGKLNHSNESARAFMMPLNMNLHTTSVHRGLRRAWMQSNGNDRQMLTCSR